MTDYGAQDVSTTTLGTNQFPISEVWTPNSGFSATEGGTQSTDAGGKKSAPVSVSVKDGQDVTQGTSTDANTVNSVMGRLTKIRDLLNATLTVSGTVTANAGTNLNTSSLALEAGGNLASLVTNTADLLADGDFLATLGNKTDAKSTATDATSISIMQVLKEISAMVQAPASTPVTGTFWQATQPVSGTVTANAGTNLNTSALALEAGHLATIDSHIPAQGQALAAASMPVVLPAAQITTLTPPAAITGFALEAGHLATIDTHTPAQGQNTMANSSPVVIASNQSAFPVTQGAGAAAGTSWRTAGDFTEIAGAGTGTVTGVGTFFIPATDVSAYKFLSLHLTGTFNLTLLFECSNDNANWVSCTLNRLDTQNANNAGTSTTATNTMWGGAVNFRWFRVRCTIFTSNTSLAGNLELYTAASAFFNSIVAVVQSGTWTVQPGNTPNTTPWLVKPHDGTNPLFLAAAALADAMSNPTIGGIQDFAMRFNGTSWDRARNNWNTTTGDTGAKTATFNGATQTNYDARGAIITVILGTVSGTSPTLATQMQWSPDGGTTWLNFGAATAATAVATGNTIVFFVYPTNMSLTPGASPTAFTTNATLTTNINAPLPRTWRQVYTIAGTTPSLAFTAVEVNYIL
jgi:hypothetical protein